MRATVGPEPGACPAANPLPPPLPPRPPLRAPPGFEKVRPKEPNSGEAYPFSAGPGPAAGRPETGTGDYCSAPARPVPAVGTAGCGGQCPEGLGLGAREILLPTTAPPLSGTSAPAPAVQAEGGHWPPLAQQPPLASAEAERNSALAVRPAPRQYRSPTAPAAKPEFCLLLGGDLLGGKEPQTGASVPVGPPLLGDAPGGLAGGSSDTAERESKPALDPDHTLSPPWPIPTLGVANGTTARAVPSGCWAESRVESPDAGVVVLSPGQLAEGSHAGIWGSLEESSGGTSFELSGALGGAEGSVPVEGPGGGPVLLTEKKGVPALPSKSRKGRKNAARADGIKVIIFWLLRRNECKRGRGKSPRAIAVLHRAGFCKQKVWLRLQEF